MIKETTVTQTNKTVTIVFVNDNNVKETYEMALFATNVITYSVTAFGGIN